MPEILTLLSCLTFELNNTSLKHLSCIIQAMLAMSGRVTMRLDIALGGKRRELSNYSAIFLQPQELADAHVGVLSHPLLLSPRKVRELLAAALALPLEMKWLPPNQVTRPMGWIGSFPVWRIAP